MEPLVAILGFNNDRKDLFLAIKPYLQHATLKLTKQKDNHTVKPTTISQLEIFLN
jgi:hypothetical protein